MEEDITTSPVLCAVCFEALHAKLFGAPFPAASSSSSSSSPGLAGYLFGSAAPPPPPSAREKRQPTRLTGKDAGTRVGIFVTWQKKDRVRGWRLRGCIGSLSPIPLEPGLREYAIKAASEDSRFPPMSKEEFAYLKCGVSLLVNFERDLRWDEWEVGVHGILIKFRAPSGHSIAPPTTTYRATYLPEVAPSQGWSKLETIRSLCEKAGYSGPVDDALLACISLERYTSTKTEMSYEEWNRRILLVNGKADSYLPSSSSSSSSVSGSAPVAENADQKQSV